MANKKTRYNKKTGQMQDYTPKTTGIKGTTSSVERELHRKIISDIYEKYEVIGVDALEKLFKEEIGKINDSYGDDDKKLRVPTIQTIKKRVKECGFEIARSGTPAEEKDTLSYEDEELSILNNKFKNDVRQIRFYTMDCDAVLYDAKNKTITSKKFCEPFQSYRRNKRSEEEDSENQKKKYASDKNLLHILIIFSISGIEDYIGRHFKNTNKDVLYTSTHNGCLEIVTTIGKGGSVLKGIFKIIDK